MSKSLTISQLAVPDLKQAAGVVANAFLTDPADHIKAVWKGSDDKVLRQNVDLFELLLKAPSKEVYVVKEGDEILAVYGLHHSQHCHLSLWQQAKMVFPMLMATGLNLPRLIHWHDQWGSLDPKEEHWHLSPMCVKPGSQGKGIGKMMLEHLTQLLDQRGIGGYLETGKWENVQFYQKFGYELRDEIKVYGATTWTMWRKPKAK